ncbi:dihydrolipoyl dehydrogenase [bacterium]|nr:dihydrolipoyl dehydrogenase [bacterium]
MSDVQSSFDILVLGGGPGGYVAAIRAAQLGRSVALVEREALGGVCLNWGCVPSKALLRSAQLYQDILRAGDFGLKVAEPGFDWSAIVKRSRQVADRTRRGVNYLMKKNGITVVEGRGELLGRGKMGVKGENGELELAAKDIILAVGGHPRAVPGLEIDRTSVITSREALALPELPRSVLIVGAGAIGIEFAYMLNSFGVTVTVVELLERILPLEDEEVSEELHRIFTKRGIKFITGAKVTSLSREGGLCRVTVESASGSTEIDTEKVLLAVGVAANTEGIGLEAAGVETERGFIRVDDTCRTAAKGVSAIGDCIGAPLLAHAASREALVAVDSLCGLPALRPAPGLIPGAIYCEPQVASIGLTEKKAEAAGFKVRVGRFPFRPLGKALASGNTDGFAKLVIDSGTGKLLGAHLIGPEATELIPELSLARWLDLDAAALHRAVHPHPTFSEAVAEAAADCLGQAIHI